jgi:hypothetical protein
MRRAAVIAAALALAACAKKAPNATREECRQYRAKLFELLPDAEREHWRASGLDKASKLELDFCQQRVTSAEVACVRNKTTLDDALACKPTVDLRPADMRRTPEECSAYREHVVQLAADGEKTETVGPPLSVAMAKIVARECERWMSKARYECGIKAASSPDLMMCRD